MTAPETTIPDTDKDYPYRRWAAADSWRDKLYRRASHKALDIAEDMDFNQQIDRSQSGMSWKELAVIAAALLGTAGLGLHYFGTDKTETTTTNTTQPAGPDDSAYTVKFFDRNGNPIDVPHISQRPKEQPPKQPPDSGG